MTRKYVNLFMWGYQEHFAIKTRLLTEAVLRRIGAVASAQVLLVGVRKPGSKAAHGFCIEPEEGAWPVSLFSNLDREVENEIPNHAAQDLFYGNERAMQEKPENIRRSAIREQVKRHLEGYDAQNAVFSYVATVVPVDHYHVATVVQIPRSTVDAHPEFAGHTWEGEPTKFSLLRCCLDQIGAEVALELLRPEPGRSGGHDTRNADELTRRAAADFMLNVEVQIAGNYMGRDLWRSLNAVSALRYEGNEVFGRVAFVRDPADAELVVELTDPAPWKEARWCRKLLEMSTRDLPLVATADRIIGLGRPRQGTNVDIAVDFHGHHEWELRSGEALHLRTQAGTARLPLAAVPPERFQDTASRRFPAASAEDLRFLTAVLSAQAARPHGSLVVIAEDAKAEAARLVLQSMPIKPVMASEDVLANASRIDGALLLDPKGVCHAIGVVLDGAAHPDCTPARGARFNSALRYVSNSTSARLAIVVSDDRTVDVVPLLRPRLSSAALQAAVQALDQSTSDNFHAPRKFLDQHRFYLSANQCERVNAALDRIESEPLEVGEIRFNTDRFEQDPEFDESYLQ